MKNIVTIHTPEHIQIPFTTAGIGTRALAKLIDFFCIGIAIFPLGIIGMMIASIAETTQGQISSVVTAILIFLASAIPLAYFVFTEYWMKGQTIGKRVMGLRVIQDNGKNPSFFSVFLRNLLQLADLLPGLYLLGMIVIFIHRQEKRLGDLVAGTLVIAEKKEKQEELVFQYATLHLREEEKEIFVRLSPASGELYLVLESFLLRREDLSSHVRQKLAGEIIEKGWPEIQTRSGYEEAFLEKVYLYLRQTRYPSHYPKVIPASFPLAG
ncbi:RDD family protein [Paenactinomyces guangxiensis]|uniref:RDD family protein n=1 Tax=Paenactinomyces guangxiensis TaxID=1490290 RepID=A0A7W1WUN2_9BACL|nr:RDD family protein [Paenactinomyces guangxiensis]MBA4496374.1 RDD family protein [Paenactinomyces guangxiensis]MBH8593513.1 RDD family protein [Paenactinomyces guangxiensis]